MTRQPFPYNQDGQDRGRDGRSRGALMGRSGSDPRAVWPHGVMNESEARARVAEAKSQIDQFPDDASWQTHHAAKLSEARATLAAIVTPYAGRLNLRKVPMSGDGYDPGGAYWGHDRLYCAWSPDQRIVVYLEARGHRDAAAKVREDYPAARIVSHGEVLS